MFLVAKHHFVCSIVGEITGNSVDYNLEGSSTSKRITVRIFTSKISL